VALVFEDKAVGGPATHVLIIGVGDYPHLPGGGSSTKAKFDAGMEQLSSPPESARVFADWFISRFSNDRRPLATVELLIGDKNRRYQVPERNGVAAHEKLTGRAGLKDITGAAIRWKARGDEHPDNLLIFYFCGHGLSQGEEFAVVASDYGGDASLPLKGLIDIPKFLVRMSDCAATDQCFFFDACREADDTLVHADFDGSALVQKTSAPTGGLKQCVYYSTLYGKSAHGKKGQPSFYTKAVLHALNGPAAENSTGVWRVNSVRMFEGISHMMVQFAEPDYYRVQFPQSGSQIMFDLHTLPGKPELPFLIGFAGHQGPSPPPSVIGLKFSQNASEMASFPETTPPLARRCEWKDRHFETWLPLGLTAFELHKTGVGPVADDHYLNPPGAWFRER
jgi:hypothetical protein